ncbi:MULTISPECIES: AbgT family transporter [Prauserella salsuginis group]|uniref:AbgT family transporter n=1 Tax=Prauserella salsuginis TaxID=387889 RepID=A0ABW6G7Z4_9PSEU|nr:MULTISPECIES: AbgT family transporter [Prauserella salsuginis group]MCR3721701.1 aminobenzoyl-glutamate transport protein [Prauserella flava]MCR3734393.1 aminobenzoyl-glutamate transport protein [Prauserella salsuginis]
MTSTETNAGPPETSRPLRWLLRLLGVIERVGNKLPHPFWLFVLMAGVVIVLSGILDALGVFAVSPADGERVEITSLLSRDGLHMMLGEAVDNFASFPPLALIVAVMLGVAVAERSGMLTALLRRTVTRVQPKYLTFALSLAGISASVASDAAYVVLVPLGALVFKAAGRSPILGLVVAYASIAAGYDASVFITAGDVLFAGITTSAAELVQPGHVVSPLANYFFTASSAIVLALVITAVTEFVLTRRAQSIEVDGDGVDEELGSMTLSDAERKGLRNAGWVLLGIVVVVAAALIPPSSPARGEDGGVLDSAVVTGIAVVLGLTFLLTGYVYGRTTGSLTRAREIPVAMAQGVRDLAPVIVLFFAASQFIAYFNWTNMGEVVAIRGAELLDHADVPTVVMFLGMLVAACVMGVLLTSGSALWTLIAPVFVPMFLLLNVPAETTLALYRIADSGTNLISPMSPYFAMALGFLQRYRKQAGIGTLMSLTLPIALSVLTAWTLLFLVWWGIGIPLGPGAPVR